MGESLEKEARERRRRGEKKRIRIWEGVGWKRKRRGVERKGMESKEVMKGGE